MTETDTAFVHPTDVVGRILFPVSYGLVIAGGTLLSATIVMVVVSILGRALFNAPIYGDFEMVAMGTAISVSLFLPYCHLNRGNVIVDLFLAGAPERFRTGCDVFASLLLCVLAGVLAWRTLLGNIDMIAYDETTMILAIPIWWAFPFVVLSLGLLSISALYTATRDLLGLVK